MKISFLQNEVNRICVYQKYFSLYSDSPGGGSERRTTLLHRNLVKNFVLRGDFFEKYIVLIGEGGGKKKKFSEREIADSEIF